MELQQAGADNETEVQEIVQTLFANIRVDKPARSKREIKQATMHVNHLLQSFSAR
jgi:hypothetical protein